MRLQTLALPLALLLLLPAAPRAQEPAAALTSASGRVSVNGRPLKLGAPVSAGDELVVERGEAVIAFSDGSTVRLGRGSRLKVAEKSAAQTSLTLLKGRLDAWVQGLVGRRFRVRSGTAVASVRGTVFSVLNDGAKTSFLLFQGELGVADEFGQSVILSPNQRLESSELGLGSMGSMPAGTQAPAEPDVPVPPAPGAKPDDAARGSADEGAEEAPESLPAAETTHLPPPPPVQEQANDESGCVSTVSPSAPCP